MKNLNLIEETDYLIGEEGHSLEEKLIIFKDIILDFKSSNNSWMYNSQEQFFAAYSFVEEIISNIEIEIRDQKLKSIGI
jgi:hypothetical protein